MEMSSLSAVFLGNGSCVCVLVIMASMFRTVVLIDAKPLILWSWIYACSASSAVTHPVVSGSAEARGIPHSKASDWRFWDACCGQHLFTHWPSYKIFP